MTYQGIVYISNEIRFVLDTARQVNLAAQNASLAARRAGNAKGFQAVSAELKNFSQLLAVAMNGMSANILGIARGVSGAYREARCTQLYMNTESMVTHHEGLRDAMQRVKGRELHGLELLQQRIRGLDLQVRQSLRVCNNGRALARSAMIEATRGGELEKMLSNVAQDIERTIDAIYGRLKRIGSRLRNEQENV